MCWYNHVPSTISMHKNNLNHAKIVHFHKHKMIKRNLEICGLQNMSHETWSMQVNIILKHTYDTSWINFISSYLYLLAESSLNQHIKSCELATWNSMSPTLKKVVLPCHSKDQKFPGIVDPLVNVDLDNPILLHMWHLATKKEREGSVEIGDIYFWKN